MKLGRLFLSTCLLWLVSDSAQAQTKLKLATIIPGTENVQLVQNGDFQFQGAATFRCPFKCPSQLERHESTDPQPAFPGLHAHREIRI